MSDWQNSLFILKSNWRKLQYFWVWSTKLVKWLFIVLLIKFPFFFPPTTDWQNLQFFLVKPVCKIFNFEFLILASLVSVGWLIKLMEFAIFFPPAKMMKFVIFLHPFNEIHDTSTSVHWNFLSFSTTFDEIRNLCMSDQWNSLSLRAWPKKLAIFTRTIDKITDF